uniref:Major facilitator superfamily (MFS) profile domain-containing protein n=1 Tax=Oryza brachyantha TaxID=4533 RepID=J3LZ52_ORYBR
MAVGGFVDWRGNPINRKVHGGVRAAWFVYFLTVVTSIVNVPNMLNMVTYLHGTMHMGVSSSSTTVTNVLGATSGFALLGAFLSDSYITRARTILLFGPLEFLGYGLLALQAHLPSLRPPPCDAEAEASSCEEIHGRNAVLLYAALYVGAFGDGFMRACMPPLGADQFDRGDPSESRQQSSFFNWYTFGISLGGSVGLVLVVWLENSEGWDIGFGACALLILLGLLVVAAGLPLYRNHVPEGSPLTRILQVLVVAFKNRKLQHPEKLEEAREGSVTEQVLTEAPSQTSSSLKFLDKACINGGRDGAWSVCSRKKVEETKAVLRVLPVFISSLIGYMSNPLLFTFTVQQGGMMNTRLGKIHVSPATLFIIPSAFQMALLPVYDRFLVPLLRRRTGYASGVTHLQRVGAGFAAVVLASAIAAIVERKRKADPEQMSLFWLAPQFFLLGVSDVTSFPGLLELFSSEAPRGMKSIASALFWCELGLSSWLATLLVQVVNRATRRRGGGGAGGGGGGATLNSSRLDLFYWVVAAVGLLGFLNYLFWASRYKYRQDPRLVDEPSADQDSP